MDFDDEMNLIIKVSNCFSDSNTLNFDDVIGVIFSENMQGKRKSETLGNVLTIENRER